MRLTPAYLTAVATFYDMFGRCPKGRARRLRVHEHLVLAARRRRAVRGDAATPPATTRDFNVRAFECLGACDIAPMASVNGEYVGPLARTTAAIVDDVAAGRAGARGQAAAAARARDAGAMS